MVTHATTCPRCLRPLTLPDDADFCPHCGQGGLGPTPPGEPLVVGDLTIRVGRRLGIGDACNLYHCTFGRRRETRAGVFKIARDAQAGVSVGNGRDAVLRVRADCDDRLRAFLPRPVTTLGYRAASERASRQAVVLAYDPAVASPDALFSLAEVQAQHPQGIDARDMAWMWRRLLAVLGGVHRLGRVHAAVTPAHVMVEPFKHGVVLVGWGASAASGTYVGPRTSAYADWFGPHAVATPALDIRTAARSMLALLGQHLPEPPPVEPALLRYFDRCLAAAATTDAAGLLVDFDRLIETLWGPRRFRPFTMPARQTFT